jgi:hypothetical protein
MFETGPDWDKTEPARHESQLIRVSEKELLVSEDDDNNSIEGQSIPIVLV